MKINNLVKVSTYAKQIGKSVELVRVWIRTGKFKENREYVIIDGMTFINTDKANEKHS